jgi:hypothetical protein
VGALALPAAAQQVRVQPVRPGIGTNPAWRNPVFRPPLTLSKPVLGKYSLDSLKIESSTPSILGEESDLSGVGILSGSSLGTLGTSLGTLGTEPARENTTTRSATDSVAPPRLGDVDNSQRRREDALRTARVLLDKEQKAGTYRRALLGTFKIK